MIIFPSGITITDTEHKSLLHIVAAPEAWLLGAITGKARLRRDALINEWRPRLFADESVTGLPADPDDLATLILARSDYRNRLQQDAALSEPTNTHNTDKYAAVTRSGSTVTLVSSGITVADTDANYILAYVQDISDWLIGALMGQVNRGKKKMIAKYHPIILADSSVTTTPATEDGLINMIVARADYRAA